MMIRTWALGILCVLVTSCFVAYTIHDHRADSLVKARTHMVNSVHYLNLDIERTFYGLDQTFKGVQNYLSAFHHTPENSDLENLLNELVSESPFLTSLSIIDSIGDTRYWSGTDPKPSLRYNDCFSIHKTHSSEQLYIGRPVAAEGSAAPHWTFGVSKGIRDNDGKLLSVLVAQIDLDYLKIRFQGLKLSDGTSLLVSSRDDYVYLHLPDDGNHIGKYIRGITLRNQQNSKILIVRHQAPDGESSYSASRQVGTSPLFVTMTMSEAGILSNWEHSTGNTLFLGIGISAILLFMTYRVASYQKKEQQSKEKLRKLASTDALTGLANRRFVLEQSTLEIRKSKRSGSPLSFVLIDLDHFKEVNDSYGHETGDMVLKETASILRKLCREADIVSRYGGEEFLLVLPNTALQGALVEAERIRCALARTCHWCKNEQFVVTASFGISQWVQGEEDYEQALRRADDALYKVKHKGRNSIMSLPIGNVTLLRKDFKHQRNRR